VPECIKLMGANVDDQALSLQQDTQAMTRWVYSFGDGKAEGQAGMKNLLGGKGANLAEMSNLGLPVPPEFTTAIQVCIKPLHRALQQTDGTGDN
jgi:hypothetical protein